jgi:hypothetical protein
VLITLGVMSASRPAHALIGAAALCAALRWPSWCAAATAVPPVVFIGWSTGGVLR